LTNEQSSSTQLRSFGLLVGSLFALIGVWPMVIHGEAFRWWAMALAGLFILPALIMPWCLRPIHRAWMFMGHVLGWINTRIILAIGFYGIMMPVGLAMRFVGRDPMQRQYIAEITSYRVTRADRHGRHMRQQF
jgi:hypothetical protein